MKPTPTGRKNGPVVYCPRRGDGLLLCILLAAVMAVLFYPLNGHAESDPVTLNVALYPYVPDQERFRQAIESEWYIDHPDVKINFVSWDCYSKDPEQNLDVFVYDSIFFYDFLEKGYLLPLSGADIQNAGDLIPAALSAGNADGITYAIPQLLCTNLLFGRDGDDEILNVKNIVELYQVIGNSGEPAVPPSGADSLLVWIPDRASLMSWYTETRIDQEQRYTEWVELPEIGKLDPDVMGILSDVQMMAGSQMMTYSPPDGNAYIRGTWFADGYGRAYIGYSEALSAMGDAAESMEFHRIALSDGEDIPMLYADIASINSEIDEQKKPYAIELLNLMTGNEVLVQALSSTQADQFPQYLLSARLSVYDELAKTYPIYGLLKDIAADPQCKIFMVRPSGRVLLEQAGKVFEFPLPSEKN